jgi:hypothetical protein
MARKDFPWDVSLTPKADKAKAKLSGAVQDLITVLTKQIALSGPLRKDWRHFGPLKGHGDGVYHCHLKSGKPTYVACWKILNKREKVVEVYYVGTHENAPY